MQVTFCINGERKDGIEFFFINGEEEKALQNVHLSVVKTNTKHATLGGCDLFPYPKYMQS